MHSFKDMAALELERECMRETENSEKDEYCMESSEEDADTDDEAGGYFSDSDLDPDLVGLETEYEKHTDAEAFDCEVLGKDEVEKLWNEEVQNSIASKTEISTSAPNVTCQVCMELVSQDSMSGLTCGHQFCCKCWQKHFRIKIQTGLSRGTSCMANGCDSLVQIEFVSKICLVDEGYSQTDQGYSFSNFVENHPELRFCPGPNCDRIVWAAVPQAKRVTCSQCQTSFCFLCGLAYHAPASCQTMMMWLMGCGKLVHHSLGTTPPEDSKRSYDMGTDPTSDKETVTYISKCTKRCPKCRTCIEKNGGCNRMKCTICDIIFCWDCLADWKESGHSYFYCDGPRPAGNFVTAPTEGTWTLKTRPELSTRDQVRTHSFYQERWKYHANSVWLIERNLQDMLMTSDRKFWMDKSAVRDAAAFLLKCHHTLQYSYPHAYYLESKKPLFDFQQAELEKLVENISCMLENEEFINFLDLQAEMDTAEKWRMVLLTDFLEKSLQEE